MTNRLSDAAKHKRQLDTAAKQIKHSKHISLNFLGQLGAGKKNIKSVSTTKCMTIRRWARKRERERESSSPAIPLCDPCHPPVIYWPLSSVVWVNGRGWRGRGHHHPSLHIVIVIIHGPFDLQRPRHCHLVGASLVVGYPLHPLLLSIVVCGRRARWASTRHHCHCPSPTSMCHCQSLVLEIDIVMSSLLFMLITYYSVMTDTNEHD